MFHKVHSHKQTENVWITRKTLPAELLGHQWKKTTWVCDFNTVIVNLYASECSLLIIISMSEGIYQRLAENIQRHFPLLCSCTGSMYVVVKFQLALQPAKCLLILSHKRTTKSLIINDMQLACSFELSASHYCMEEQIFGMIGEEEDCTSLHITILGECLYIL